ncbi:haloacid dehalogenase type II [Peribacillus deserti]|uniref:Haloacid dehalogenase type II n=1 Tax=Peribacillus deserti TaxID=673318 RepID=A0A2N5M575_9BACI|nr:haloacid dehalogenase type II [Peribacillus deserti]PLT29423.1 haloacid dehalogenase type II [Peribacillus deserti]
MSSSINGIIFDVYGTLFDVHSVKTRCEEFFPGKGESVSLVWRRKQLEYAFIRQLMGTYKSFHHVTRDALRYAVKEHNEKVSAEQEDSLMEQYLFLDPFPEVKDVLDQVSHKKLAVLSNGSYDLLNPLIKGSGLSHVFHSIISIDEVKHYKPAPSAYGHGAHMLELRREEILFVSSNGWDIAGAKNFGYQTAWINRLNLPVEELDLPPDKEFRDLSGILVWK